MGLCNGNGVCVTTRKVGFDDLTTFGVAYDVAGVAYDMFNEMSRLEDVSRWCFWTCVTADVWCPASAG